MPLANGAAKNGFVLALLSLLLIQATSICAQPSPAAEVSGRAVLPADEQGFTISKEVNEVNLVFTVTDSKGHLLNSLNQRDFQLLDNHKAVEQIRYFHRETVLPLRVAVLIDVSSSIAYRFGFEQKAAGVFLRKVLRKGVDEAFVATFGDKVRVIEDWNKDPNTLFAKVRTLPKPEGNTALYDAIEFACKKLSARASNRVERSVIILITDGEDTASKRLMYDAQQATDRSEVVLFALSTNNIKEGEYPKGEAVLDLLSQHTGGQVLAARDKDEIAHGFKKIEKSLRSQYALGYVPGELETDGRYHSVEIRPRKSGLLVHGRKGYFAPRGSSPVP